MKPKSTLAALALAAITLTITPARAADGTWLGTTGNWSATGTWSGGAIADGADFTANFNGVNIAADQTITVDTARTIGNITFTDATTASNNLTLSGANPLTLDVTTGAPVINVTDATRTLTISSAITGSDGLTKSGAGTLLLSGANTYTGATTVSVGTLRFNAATAIGGADRSVAVATGASVAAGYAMNNAFLNRLEETGNAFNVNMVVASANALDFGSSTGASLPNAVLFGAGNTAYTGILTPGGNTFRLGNLAAAWGNANTFTMSALTGASNSLVVSGTGLVVINAASTYKGTTTVNPGGSFRYDGTIDNIGGGPGVRDILVGAGGNIARSGAAVNNAFLQRLVETPNAFTIYMGNASNANNLDFSGTAGGANLPNASIAFYDSAGTPSFVYSGTITPANNTYRLGGIKASANNNTSLSLANALTGGRSVVANGGNVRILNSDDFTGDITINAGNFNISGNINASNATVAGNGSLSGGNYLGAITTNGTLIHSAPGTQILAGLITGTGGVSRDNPGTAAPSGATATPIAAGTLILANSGNSYSGTTSVLAGTLSFGSIANVGGGASALGAPTSIASGTISIGTSIGTFSGGGSTPIITPRAGGLIYTGSGHTSDRVINLSGTSGGATIDASGTGALVLTSAMTATGIGSKTLTLTGSNSASNTIGGAIVNNSTVGTTTLSASFISGAGTVVLSSVDGVSVGAAISGAGIPAGTTINAINPATRAVTLSANTTAVSSGNYTVAGVQNRTAVAKTGPGKWVLSGANTYTGGTTVSGGMLQLDYSASDTGKLSDAGVLTLAGGTLDLAGGSHTEIVASTALAAGSGSSVTRSSGAAGLAMNAITPGAGAVVTFAADNLATTDNLNTNGILGAWATVGGTDWAMNSTNAADGPITAYTGYADIAAQGPGSTITDGPTTNVRILGDGTSGPIGLGATTTTVNTVLQSNANFAATIDTVGMTLRTDAVWLSTGKAALTIGTATGDGFLTAATAGGNLALINDSASNNLTVNAVIADNGSASTLAKFGVGTLALGGANTFTGGATLGAGTLVVGNAGALGSGALTIAGGAVAAAGTIAIPNAVNANGDFSITGTGDLTLSGAMTLNGNRVITNSNTTGTTTFWDIGGTNRSLTFAGNGDTTVTGFIATGTGTLTKNGTGTLILTETNTYTGATTINAGTLRVGTGGTTGSLTSAAITNNATLIYNRSDDVSVGQVISGSGSVTQQGTGLLSLTGASTYTGATTISAGTLQIGSGGTTGSIANTSGITNNAALVYNRSNALSVGSVISGSGSLTKIGAGTLTLTNANTYTGATTLSIGTLSVGTSANLGAAAANLVFDGGTLQVTGTALTNFSGLGHAVSFNADVNVGLDINDPTNIFTVDQVLNQVSGSFTKLGAGTAILNRANTYSGNTSIIAGKLLINSPGSLDAASTVFVEAGTLGGNGMIGGSVNVAGPANLSPGASAGTLSIGSDLDLSAQAAGAGKLNFELDALAATSDKITVTGTLAIGTEVLGFSNFVFTNLGGLELGTYKLITSGGVTGTLDPADLRGVIGAFSGTLQLTGNDLELVVGPKTPYENWIAGFSVGSLTDPTDDPDRDGKPNFLEFALNSSPADGGSQGKVFTKLATVSGTPNVLTLTIASRSGAAFAAAANNQQAVVAADSLTYLIEASNTLADWGAPLVEEVTGADATAIQATLTPPAPDAGWIYHTFRTDGDAASDASNFIRVKVTSP
jgi:autotransporter-associated beta strand protein